MIFREQVIPGAHKSLIKCQENRNRRRIRFVSQTTDSALGLPIPRVWRSRHRHSGPG